MSQEDSSDEWSQFKVSIRNEKKYPRIHPLIWSPVLFVSNAITVQIVSVTASTVILFVSSPAELHKLCRVCLKKCASLIFGELSSM